MLSTLCEAVVEDLYGSTAKRIVNRLDLLGRLSAPEISRMLGLHPTVVLRTLVNLVQLRLVKFWTDPQTSKIHYSSDSEQMYNLLRTGWFSSLLKSGALLVPADDPSAGVLSTLAVHGVLTVGALAELAHVEPSHIKELLSKKLLIQVCPHDFWPEIDLKTHLQKSEFTKLVSNATGLALSESQKKVQVAQAVKIELDKIQRRARPDDELPSSALVGVNIPTFLAAGRRQELVEFVSNRISPITAKVYSAALQLAERSITSIHQKRIPSSEHNTSSHMIANMLQDEDLQPPVKMDVKEEPVDLDDVTEQPNKKQRLDNGGARSSYTPSKVELVAQHMQTLDENPIRFVRRIGDRGGGEWFIPFDQVVEDLKRVTFDNIVKEKFGNTAARLMRVIRDQVKIDEKALGQIALLHGRNIRHEVSKLQLFGFVDLQEVPRGNDRAPGRNFYFWHHRPEKAYSRVVQELYGSMTKVMADLAALRAVNGTLLNKLYRKDVIEDPDLLTVVEKEALSRYREKELAHVTKLMKIDRQVRIFKDY